MIKQSTQSRDFLLSDGIGAEALKPQSGRVLRKAEKVEAWSILGTPKVLVEPVSRAKHMYMHGKRCAKMISLI